MYSTTHDGQKAAEIRVFQGEEDDTRFNTLVGGFMIQGLSAVVAPNQILVRLDLDLSGILRVTATERATGLAKQVVIDNMMERFRHRERTDAIERIDTLFADVEVPEGAEDEELAEGVDTRDEGLEEVPERAAQAPEDGSAELQRAVEAADVQIAKAGSLEASASKEDAAEMKGLIQDLRAAVARGALTDIRRITTELEDLIFYLNDA
jgi:molecular chaperone DnaK